MNRRAFLRLSAAITVGVLLSACTPTQPPTPVEDAVGAAVDPPRVTLLSAGAGPLTELRYRDIDAGEQLSTVAVTTGFAQRVFPTPEAVPADRPVAGDVTTTTDLRATTVAPENAETATRSVFLEVTNPRSSDPAGAATLASAEGFGFGMFATDTGSISSVNYAAPTGAATEARAGMESYLSQFYGLPLVFPAEAIGVGAEWTVENRTASFLQEITYRLSAFDPATGSGTVEGTVSQRPAVTVLDTSTIEGAPAQLSVLTTGGTSTVDLTFDLAKPLPTGGQVEVHTQVQYGSEGSAVRVVEDHYTLVTY